ncbi:HI0074 family nucleotidyltransferase substrate-binding subunit [Natronogracilivirga saccharolytica]|uniref:Nucleotidyltransferase substrate binding protein n=1 Tax=Natronogracilivirga saccharolytica TaxID=2812953 RepID=A0A8J7RPL1_9BACT|nr:HI0074 family nucleotidyltransferase substrate-binding subunit [Natronogracilivirga saccharolytica]MBP3193833.1 nucleotidyltransferase substrate binding protein [Natronogracilivirga saccharolytica]
MNPQQHPRWKDRFKNYQKALAQLEEFLELQDMNKYEEQGFVKAFEYTYELGWKTLQDFLIDQGYLQIAGPKQVIEQAYRDNYIDGEAWIRMHQARNIAAHVYDEHMIRDIVQKIRKEYQATLKQLRETLADYDT